MEVGLAYLPGTIVWGASSLLLSDRLVMRYGIRKPLLGGLTLMTLSLLLLARTPVDGIWAVDILPATVLIGLGGGIAFNPLLLAAMNDVKPTDSGLASGVVNTAFMMGGSLGLAVLASLAAGRTQSLLAAGTPATEALNGGYHTAFIVGGIFAAISAVLGGALIRVKMGAAAQQGAPEVAMH